jgi:LacI family transcriptional regulator
MPVSRAGGRGGHLMMTLVLAGRPMNWTIHDIAREAGVSAKTVSRVLNDENGVAEATRARITKLMDEVGYHPHTGARSMRSRTRDCIGMTLSGPPDEVPISEDLFVWMFASLYHVFGQDGQYICFDLNPFKVGPTANYARGLWEQRFAGCVICGPLRIGDKTIPRIHQAGFPYLAMGRLDSFPETSYATVDYEQGARVSVEFLTQRGHRRIAMLKAFTGYQPGQERRRGYTIGHEEAGLEPDDELIRRTSFAPTDIVNAVHRLLLDPSVTALIDASGAEDAASLREGARRAGRVPGRDFEVVVWTYTDNAAVLSEASAHVWLPVREAALEGFELFAEWYHGKREGPVQVLYPPTLYETVAEGEIPKPKPFFRLFR